MEKRQLPEDFKDFIQYLNSNNVEYLLIGGWAVSIYGNPRLTKDIDFLISVKEENIVKFKKAMEEFGAPPVDIEGLKKNKDSFIRMGVSPIQIDVLQEASGIIMEECYKRKNILELDGLKINIISIKDLIINKRAAGRDQDITDANKLEKLMKINKNQYISLIQNESNNKKTSFEYLNNIETINERIEKLISYKHEVKNEVLVDFRGNKIKINKTEIISEKDNICKFVCIDKKNKNIYILQQIKDNNTERWYFDKDFNKISSIEFIKQYRVWEIENKKNKDINKKNENNDVSDGQSGGSR